MSKILIVDDAIFMRKVIKELLEENDYTDIIEAEDGVEAVEMYKEHNPDLVIMDITMPALDGIGTVKEIKKFDKNASILMCSAMGQESIVQESLVQGAKEFVVKPFKPERLMKSVKKLLS